MSDVCENPACGHTEDEHDDYSGMCNRCRCVMFRAEGEWDEDDDGPQELNFDGAA